MSGSVHLWRNEKEQGMKFIKLLTLQFLPQLDTYTHVITGVATVGPRGAMAPSLLSYFSIVFMSWFTFAIVNILCCGPLTGFLLATPLHVMAHHDGSVLPLSTCTDTSYDCRTGLNLMSIPREYRDLQVG